MNRKTDTVFLTTLVLTLGAALGVHAEEPKGKAGEKAERASVHLGEDGKLVYVADERGNKIPDFSNCGYMGGGVKIPDVPVKITLEPRPEMVKELGFFDPTNPDIPGADGDDTERIQKAIDKVSAMPLDENGFRGAVLLKRGVYRTSKPLRIQASGVVLRGEGQAKDGSVILCKSPNQRIAMVEVYGERIVKEIPGTRRKIADKYVPWGVRSFNMESVDGLAVGDKVTVFRPVTMEWLEAIDQAKNRRDKESDEYRFFNMRFERVITAMDGNRITLDAPTVNAMEDKYGGGFVYKYTDEGAVTQTGVEHLRLIGAGPPGGWYNGKFRPNYSVEYGVSFTGGVNCWARNVSVLHVRNSAIEMGRKEHTYYDDLEHRGGNKHITVQECAFLAPRGRGSRSAYYYRYAQLCLIQRCVTRRGRHGNSAATRVLGPNVYLDMVNQTWDAGPHRTWCMGFLYDNVSAFVFIANKRGDFGWIGAQMVFWNVWGTKSGVKDPPTAANYIFGKARFKGGRKMVGQPLEPRSLYIKQLEERLGKEAVENVTTEAQRQAVIDPTSELARDLILWEPLREKIGKVPPKLKENPRSWRVPPPGEKK